MTQAQLDACRGQALSCPHALDAHTCTNTLASLSKEIDVSAFPKNVCVCVLTDVCTRLPAMIPGASDNHSSLVDTAVTCMEARFHKIALDPIGLHSPKPCL